MTDKNYITIRAIVQVGEDGLPVPIRSSRSYAIYCDRKGKLPGKRIGEERKCEIKIYPKDIFESFCNMPEWT